MDTASPRRRWFQLSLREMLFLVTLTAGLMLWITAEPQVAWNSGARERLGEALRKIGRQFSETNASGVKGQLDPRDFMPHAVKDQAGFPAADGVARAKKHGLTVRWRERGRYRNVVFYPIAISREIVVSPHASTEPTPQIIMVPVEEADIPTLPTLYGCSNTKDLEACQLRRIETLFTAQHMERAAVLLSDGTVLFVPIGDLQPE